MPSRNVCSLPGCPTCSRHAQLVELERAARDLLLRNPTTHASLCAFCGGEWKAGQRHRDRCPWARLDVAVGGLS